MPAASQRSPTVHFLFPQMERLPPAPLIMGLPQISVLCSLLFSTRALPLDPLKIPSLWQIQGPLVFWKLPGLSPVPLTPQFRSAHTFPAAQQTEAQGIPPERQTHAEGHLSLYPHLHYWFLSPRLNRSEASLIPFLHPPHSVTKSLPFFLQNTTPWIQLFFPIWVLPGLYHSTRRAPPQPLSLYPWLWPVIISDFFLLEPTEWLGDLLDAFMATDKRANDDTQLSLPPEPGCAPQGFPLWPSKSRLSLYHQLSVTMGLVPSNRPLTSLYGTLAFSTL